MINTGFLPLFIIEVLYSICLVPNLFISLFILFIYLFVFWKNVIYEYNEWSYEGEMLCNKELCVYYRADNITVFKLMWLWCSDYVVWMGGIYFASTSGKVTGKNITKSWEDITATNMNCSLCKSKHKSHVPVTWWLLRLVSLSPTNGQVSYIHTSVLVPWCGKYPQLTDVCHVYQSWERDLRM